MAERRPNRTLGGPHDEFWGYCAAGELRLQRCGACGEHTWPPVERCERCGAGSLRWEPTAGTGRLVSWATFDHPYHRELPLPWHTVLVELTEGPLFVANPLGFGVEQMRHGMALQVRFIDCQDDTGDFKLPVFAPADGLPG